MKALQPGFSKEILSIQQRKRESLRVTYSYFCCKQPMSKPCLVLTMSDGGGKRKAVVTKWTRVKLKGLTASGSEKKQDSVCCLSSVTTGMRLSQVPSEWFHDNSSYKPPRKTQTKWPKVPKESHSFAGLVPPCSSYHKSNPGRLSKQAPETKSDFPRKETMPNSWF